MRISSDVAPRGGVMKWTDDNGNEGGGRRQRKSEWEGQPHM